MIARPAPYLDKEGSTYNVRFMISKTAPAIPSVMRRPSERRIAVLGGGIQGCCVALALAESRMRVTLFDRHDALLNGAATANEAKIHLGYIYAGDTTLATARLLTDGALAFATLMRRFVGAQLRFSVSKPFVYAVHRKSHKSVDEVAAHLDAVHANVRKAAANRPDAYFGIDLGTPPRRYTQAELEAAFDPTIILAAFDTQEIAINPLPFADALRERIAADPYIELKLRHTVTAVEDDGAHLCVLSKEPDGVTRDSYDHVVNALWDGRLAVDSGRGLRPSHQWLYRFKYGIRFRPPSGVPPLPSMTAMLGPFGDTVSYEDGSFYLSWYPICLRGQSMELAPPVWPAEPEETLRKRVASESVRAMAAMIPVLRRIDPDALPELGVRGGAIVAWGESDIDDPESGLHRRFEIGVSSSGRYHSVDPGKFMMAPYFASVVAQRIINEQNGTAR